jgi:hypothetical protein
MDIIFKIASAALLQHLWSGSPVLEAAFLVQGTKSSHKALDLGHRERGDALNAFTC